jgi:transcriptional regulator with XRE-family HTH domain
MAMPNPAAVPAATAAWPDFHLRLKRGRRLRGLKQSYIAAMLDVDQATVSRWESGALRPLAHQAQAALRLLGATVAADEALIRLVRTSSLCVHLVGDEDHRLLAFSASRKRQWGRVAERLLGESLWRFATPEIVEAEQRLAACGWWNQALPQAVRVATTGQVRGGLRFVSGFMQWERLWLASGEPVRLCTTLTA